MLTPFGKAQDDDDENANGEWISLFFKFAQLCHPEYKQHQLQHVK